MNRLTTLALAMIATLALASSANAVTYVLNTTPNSDGNNVSAQATITANGDLVTLVVTNTTQGMFASNQAISDILLNFTTDVGPVSNFTQAGQRATIDGAGNITLVAGAPTRWDPNNPAGNTYLDVLGGGKPSEMIASTSIGDPNGGFDNFNPYILGTATFTFNLANASLLRLADLQFSFGTNHEFKAFGTCTFGCGGVINPTGTVPEPAGWAMMILGFAAIGGLMRRKRAQERLARAVA